MSEHLTSRRERISYATYFAGQNIIFIFVFMFLMQFFTEEVGLAPAAVGILFLIARVWDAVNDPILGAIVDKSNLKGGKYKPWITMVVVAMPITTVLLFININAGPSMNLVYAYITYIVWGMIYTISDAPVFALATAMTDKQKERTKLISFGRIGASIAGLVIAVVAIPIKMAIGWTPTAILLSVAALLTMIPIKLFTKERIKVNTGKTITVKKLFGTIFRNKYLIIFFGAFILAQFSNTLSVVNYLAIYNLQNEGIMSIFFFMMFIPMLLCAFFMVPLVGRFGKKKIILAGIAIFVISSILMYFIGYSNLIVFIILVFIRSMGHALSMIFVALITADCVEYGTWKTKERAAGVAFSIQTFTTKLTTAISGGVTGILLSVIGFQSGQIQTPETINGIFHLYSWVPAVGYIIMFFIILFKYDLTEDKVKIMIEENKVLAESD